MRILLAGLFAILLGPGVRGQLLPDVGTPLHVVKAIKAGRLIDPSSANVLENVIILIDHDSVKAIGRDIAVPDSAQVIDLSGYTVLPGLIDCHTHLTSEPSGDYYADIFRRMPVDDAVTSPNRALKTLLAGFTTCRDVGSRGLVDVALRNAINRGEIPGPRMFVATLFIGSTGSHGDINGFSPYLAWTDGPKELSGVANGVDGVRAGVKIAFGTDAGVYPHGWNAKQFYYMVKFGQTPMQAIQAATVNAADLIGNSRIGQLRRGAFADIIAVKADPLQDVRALENVSFVMKGGVIYKKS